jgi:hypothetical protein
VPCRPLLEELLPLLELLPVLELPELDELPAADLLVPDPPVLVAELCRAVAAWADPGSV